MRAISSSGLLSGEPPTIACILWVFQAMMTLARSVKAPEMVASCSMVRPRLAPIGALLDCPLQAVHRLTLVQKIENLAAEARIAEIVA